MTDALAVTHSQLRLGLLLNPWAGIGGPAGLRGSDGEAIRTEALARGVVPAAGARAERFLAALTTLPVSAQWWTWGGAMGADVLQAAAIPAAVCGTPAVPSTSADTIAAARALVAAGIDLLVFVGGDGTARDVHDAIGRQVPVLGIPAGVKMYSGVFAVAPEAAAEIIGRLASGQAVALVDAEVRDIDEAAFRADRVASRVYGELRVPGVRGFVQQVKCSPPDAEPVLQREIAAGVVEDMAPGVLYLVGTGTTTRAVLEELGLPASLLGIDAVRDGALVGRDLDAAALQDLLGRYPQARLLLSPTGGQGFLLGRGNQQLAASVLRPLLAANGAEAVVILATRSKLDALAGRPLLIDTGDVQLDAALAGLRPVLTGYRQQVLYRVLAAGSVRQPDSAQ